MINIHSICTFKRLFIQIIPIKKDRQMEKVRYFESLAKDHLEKKVRIKSQLVHLYLLLTHHIPCLSLTNIICICYWYSLVLSHTHLACLVSSYKNLDLPTKILFGDTVREVSGLPSCLVIYCIHR